MTTVTVVTPWYEHEELAPDFFGAMIIGEPDDVIVVDNASDPPLRFARVRSDVNLGFAKGSNYGLALVETDAVLFVNNDVYSADRQWLRRLREEMEPGVLVGAVLRYDKHGDVDGVSLPYLDGWCIGGMTEDIRALGGFDETYLEPAYYSDNDLCLRARARGMRLREVRTGLGHKNSTTSGGHENPETWKVVQANYVTYVARARAILEEASAA